MKKIFVGNLDFSATEDSIRSLFEQHGTVERVSLMTDRDTGRSRGFAFVEMTDTGEAERAIAALNGVNLGGRNLNVNEARPKVDDRVTVRVGERDDANLAVRATIRNRVRRVHEQIQKYLPESGRAPFDEWSIAVVADHARSMAYLAASFLFLLVVELLLVVEVLRDVQPRIFALPLGVTIQRF